MNDRLQYRLFIVLGVALCVLCVAQWRTQSTQRVRLTALSQELAQSRAELALATNSVRKADDHIAQLDERLAALGGALKSNEAARATQRQELQRLEATAAARERESTGWRKAADELQTKLRDVYAGIEKQNAAFKTLVAQRDDLAEKLNASITERNQIVARYNELARKIEAFNASATNRTSTTGEPAP